MVKIRTQEMLSKVYSAEDRIQESIRYYWAGLPLPNPPLNSMGAEPGPAAPALSVSPAPGALLYAALSPSPLSPPARGAAEALGLVSLGACLFRVEGTISGGRSSLHGAITTGTSPTRVFSTCVTTSTF